MTGHIDPEREAFKLFKEMPRDEPIQMLNLLRLRDKAAYPDGRDVSGFEAYKTYGQTSGPVFKRVGGTIVWRGAPKLTLIGPSEENWHLSFVAAYPSAAAFLEMVTDPVYQNEAVPHRQAAVLDSRLIRHTPLDLISEFS
ncbi:MAG: DUF1330 domain-containing protein [Oceanicaulis sp.]|uniref:DUF1330 domain-containing protein n=1 Tax=unclassified Oceanicaulis TaxID=2632123 RepID=UPI00006697FA|nr:MULTISPECIES: DUF1330 domain-containing protein [unclassified Oceanicaulis]EAP89720.1 hypothetical protein OA2633_10649 [Oceanicaulis sp. HTCC2633]MAB68609.1 DUF1330 domain-containing protein [Oceanicaulis sp.]MBC38607.1 DUF1330 domain-containing protein [Oceanicaulis sp.]MBG36618.1 DUF1330 domain-containing protein [Oceanicaulis sp.]HBU62924.1 DUF1330 domain-containing protein [Oceanicaulis sp.]|tara:strand:- start:16 stop:435 length:420 start_codon:yes stop_codon:yes gene_type:complete